MPKITCPNGHKLQVRDELAGKKIKCPRCGAVVLVPEPAVAEAEPEEPAEEDWQSDSESQSESDWNAGSDWGSDSESDPWNDPEEGRALPPRAGTRSPSKAVAEKSASTVRSERNVKPLIFMGLGAGVLLSVVIVVVVMLSGGEPEADQTASAIPPGPPDMTAAQPPELASVPAAKPPEAIPQPATPQPVTTQPEPATAPSTTPPMVVVSPPGFAPMPNGSPPAEKAPSKAKSEAKPPAFVDATENDIQQPAGHLLAIDHRFQMRFDREPESLRFALVKAGQEPPARMADWLTVAALQGKDQNQQRDLTLAAAVTASQTVMYLQEKSFEKLSKLQLPLSIQIGSEVMQIVAIDDFKEMAELKRTAGIFHNVDEPIRIMQPNETATVFTNQGVPFLERNTLNWFPTGANTGEGTIYVQWSTSQSRRPLRFRWDVTIGDAGSIEKMVREQEGPEDDGLAPLAGEGWPWKGTVLGLVAAADSNIKDGNRDVEKQLKKIAQTAAGRIFGRLKPAPDGRRNVSIAVEQSPDAESITVPAGAGLPLLSVDDARSKSLVAKVDAPELIPDGVLESTDEGRRLHIQWLRGLPPSGGAVPDPSFPQQVFGVRDYHCAVSADGKKVYLLSVGGLLIVLDSKTMKAEAAVQFKAKCTSVALCSEGVLVAVRDESPASTEGTDSILLRPARNAPDQVPRSLYLLDSKSLKVKKTYGIPAETLAAQEQSPVVFAGSPSSIAVMDLKQETVTDFVPVLHPAMMVKQDAAVSIESPYRLVCDPEQKTLVAIHQAPGQSQHLIFQTGNGTLRLPTKNKNRSDETAYATVSSDASILCLSSKDDPRRHFVVPGADTPLIPSMMSIPFPALIEPVSHSLWSLTETGAVTKKSQLSVTQGRRTFQVVLEKAPRQIERLGANRALLIMDNQLGVAEVKATPDFWPFEVNLRNEVPTEPLAGKTEASVTPLVMAEESGKGLRVESASTSMICWTPSGDAAILMEVDSTTSSSRLTTRLRRFDWQTRKETHCWSIQTGRAVNRCEATGAGLLFQDSNSSQYTLLNYQDLVPVWTIKSVSGLTGHRQHTMLVGMSNGVIVMDALTRRVVARAGAMNLAAAFESTPWAGHIRPTHDPAIVAISKTAPVVGLAEQYRLFHVNPEGSLVPTAEIMAQETLAEVLSLAPVTTGFKYRLTGDLPANGQLEITGPDGKSVTSIFQRVSFVAPHPTLPNVYAVVSDHHVVFVTNQQGQ